MCSRLSFQGELGKKSCTVESSIEQTWDHLADGFLAAWGESTSSALEMIKWTWDDLSLHSRMLHKENCFHRKFLSLIQFVSTMRSEREKYQKALHCLWLFPQPSLDKRSAWNSKLQAPDVLVNLSPPASITFLGNDAVRDFPLSRRKSASQRWVCSGRMNLCDALDVQQRKWRRS